MSPIARTAVRFTQRIGDAAKRRFTLTMIEEATKQADLAHFTVATLKNPSHTSNSDPRPHVTVLLATPEQAAQNKSQAVHIYHDKDENYTGHQLFQERDNKSND